MRRRLFCIAMFISTLAIAQMKPTAAAPLVPDQNKSVLTNSSNIWDVFQNRRSARNFKPDSIPVSDIVKIIDAARKAPSSGNQQPWKFLVIRDKKKINEMMTASINGIIKRNEKNNQTEEQKIKAKEIITKRYAEYFSAPVYIVVLTDNKSKYPDYNHWDGPLAAGYLMLAARALGYGTVFITDAIQDSITKEVLQIPDQYTRVCITPLGIPTEWPTGPDKKKLEEFIVYEKF